MIVFGDRTALGSTEDIGAVVRSRSTQIEQFAGIVSGLKLVAQSPDPLKAAEARSHELRSPETGDSPTTFRAGDPDSQNRFWAERVLMLVKAVDGDKRRIGWSIANSQALLDALKVHAELQAVSR